ncbi:Mobile element protein [Moraxella catarrhalis]|nr:Mobile element protein [Moraxella catarrhalis]
MSSSPKGRAGLRIREWTCAKCSTWHDSDLMPLRTFLRPSLTVWEQESPNDRAGRKSSVSILGQIYWLFVRHWRSFSSVISQ